MKKILALVLVFCLAVPFVTACSSGTTATTAPTTAGTTAAQATETPWVFDGSNYKGEVTIAVSCALTGSVPLEGASARDGARLAVDLCNAAGGVQGYKVNLQVEDDANSNDGAVNVTTRLASDANVLCQVGPIRSAGVAAIEQIVSQNKFPTVVGGTSVAIWEEGGGYIFRFRACDQIVAQAAIDYACRDLGYKNVGILYNNDDYGNGAKKVMEAYVASNYPDVKIGAAEGHNTGDKDMTAGLLACKNAGCDVIIGWTHAPECAVMTRQYRELGLDSIFFLGGPGWGMPGFHALIEDELVNGISTITDFAADNAESQTQDFLKAYKEKYGKDADSFAAYYYDGVSIVLEALKLAKTMDREGLLAAFPEVKFDGISGKIYLDTEHNMDFVHRVCTAVIKAENSVKTLTDVKFVTFYEE